MKFNYSHVIFCIGGVSRLRVLALIILNQDVGIDQWIFSPEYIRKQYKWKDERSVDFKLEFFDFEM